ncbi:MAG: portal protein [Gemmobacter sp.]
MNAQTGKRIEDMTDAEFLGETTEDPVPEPRDGKLTEWAKEPSVMDLKADLEVARSFHDAHVQNVRRWNDLRNITGKVAPKKVQGRSSIQPKLVRRQNEWRYSALSEPFNSSPDLFRASPVTFEDTFAAKQNQIILNWQFRSKIDRAAFIDEYVRTGVDEGSVIVRTGWQRQTRQDEVEVPVFSYLEIRDEAELDALEQALMLKAQNPAEYEALPVEMKAAAEYMLETQIPTVATVTGYETVVEETILVNQPTLEIVDPENLYVDPSCKNDLDKARFIIYSFETCKADLIKDGRYRNLDMVNWSGADILAQPDHHTTTPNDIQMRDELRRPIVAYEYWGYYPVEGTDELTCIVATWVCDTMIRMEESPFPDEKPPFVLVRYLPVKRQLMGEPDAEILEDNQAILGAVYRGMVDLMARSANAQQGMAKGFLDAINRRRFEKGLDYEFNPSQGDPRLSVYQHVYPEIPNSAMTMIGLQNSEAEALSGVKAFSGGLSGEAYGEVAAGIKGMLDAASKREMNILRRMTEGIKKIGRKIAAMNAVFLSEEEVVRVTNSEFVTIRRDDLKGNFDLEIDIATPEVDEARSQDLSFMLQTMGPDMDPTLSRMILAEIADLKRQRLLAEKIRQFQPQPDPLAEKLKELEIAKLEAEIQKIRSEVEKNAALARKAAAEADLKDLEFVEEETGTKHARDMDRLSGQARANQDLEVTKALLASRKPEERAPDVPAAVGFNRLTDVRSGNV